MKRPPQIAPATGRLGVLLVGLGAVSTTFIAGVHALRKKIAAPTGSLTQMGTIRLGKRTEGRSPLIRDFVPLAELDDLVFGGWDIFEEDCYEAARTAGVLDAALLEKIRPELQAIHPWTAVFDQQYVKRLSGSNVKRGASKRELADQVIDDIRRFKADNGLERPRAGLVRQHRGVHGRVAGAPVAGGVRSGARPLRSGHPVEHDLRLRGDQGGHSRTPTRPPTSAPTCRRSPPSPRRPARRWPARTSRRGRR